MAESVHGDDDRPLDEDVDLDLLEASAPGSRPPRGRTAPAGATRRGRALLSWPDTAPGWVRSPATLLLVAALAVALTAGLVGHRDRAATRTAVATERALLAVDLDDAALSSSVSIDPLTGNAVDPAPTDPVTASLEITVVNSGDSVAFVTPRGLSLDALPDGAVELSGPVAATGSGTPRGVSAPQPAVGRLAVAGGGSTRGVMPLALDCSAVPGPDTAVAGRPEWLVVGVSALGAEREERLPLSSSSGGLAQQIAQRCHPRPEVSVRVVSSQITADGGLEVVLQDNSTVPVQVDLTGRPALEVTADPALPLDLTRSGVTRVVLTGAPDCTLTRDPLVEGLLMRALPVEAADGGSTTTLDAAMTSAWWVRVVALACG